MFSLPPRNHFANGRSHSRVWVKGSCQVTVSRAIFAQNSTGSAAASSYSDGWALAWAAIDLRRLEDAALPLGVGGHRLADVVDDLRRLVDVGAVGDRDVLIDSGPDPGQVARDGDLAVGDGVDHAIEVSQGGASKAEVLDRPGDTGHADDVALAELVLDEDQ